MLAFHRTGPQTGPLVVYLHGAGISSWMWHRMIAHQSRMNCILIDLPGHGDSRHIMWRDLEDTAAHVEQVIEACAPADEAHLVGLSLGSYVAMTLMIRQPQRYTSALLSGIHAGGMTHKPLLKAIFMIAALTVKWPSRARRTGKMFVEDDGDLEGFVREAIKTSAQAMRRTGHQVIDYSLPAAAAAIQTRVLIAFGSKEHPVIRSSNAIFKETLPRHSMFEAQGLGHGWPGQDPALFARVVQDHIAGRPIAHP
ncbi:alpha/beta fold hydrolase [Actibacterium sp. 188UL27-1]|uniref:alpha/beta fold hydrolase n=1 Tax=Actibacterium sp. 188UL27-1 TaxID=2786961 RepID=UPI00195AA07B|nr:alpha/beta hydrolase [Actibacterium sp. 188UL27-1]MBM7068121.1 alpha/beta hydrolase [Actibacterium sp. 188UL27-1]